MKADKITITTTIQIDIDKAWACWTLPEHITQWTFASDDWHCPKATNDPRTGGKFSSTMAAKDGSMSFDFEGIYDEVIEKQKIAYSLADGRQIEVLFETDGTSTKITETFDPENENPAEMQRAGWQTILDNFKKHAESI